MSEERSFRFGPGSLESVQLRIWELQLWEPSCPPPSIAAMEEHVRGQVTGRYTVYCGNGTQHLVDIDDTFRSNVEFPSGEFDRNVVRAWGQGDQGAAEEVTRQMVEWTLEGWDDPCLRPGFEEEI